MAAKRQERLLERQRGAGTRQIKNTGFNLLLPDQQNAAFVLLPQKSGRARKTPQPELPPQHSTRRTPAPEDSRQLSPFRKTPIIPTAKKRGRPKTFPEAGGERDDEPEAATRKTPIIPIAKKRGRPKTVPEAEGERDDEREAATKKRKLNTASKDQDAASESIAAGNEPATSEVQVTDSQPQEPDKSAVNTAGVKRRRKRKSIGQQSLKTTKSQGDDLIRPARQPQSRGSKPKPNPPDPVEPVVIQTPEPPEYPRITTPAFQNQEGSHGVVALGPAEGPESLENGDAKDTKPKPRKGKREPGEKEKSKRGETKVADERVNNASGGRSLTQRTQSDTKPKRGRKPGYKKKALEETEQLHNPTEQHHAETSQLAENAGRAVGGAVEQASEDIVSVAKVTESQDKPKARRKKRKPIGQQSGRPKKKPTDSTTLSKPTIKQAPITKSAEEPKSKTTATAPLQKSKAKSTRPPTSVEGTDEEPANAIENPSDNEVREPQPVQPKKRGRPRKIDAPCNPPPTTKSPQPRIKKPKQTKAVVPREPPKNTIPITFYAPPSPSASDSDAMVDPLSNAAPAPGATKGINAVDVLAQTCSEMLAKTSASLAEKANASPDQRAEYRRRKKTVDMYSEELADQLFQLTVTLNTNTALTAQVRKAAAEERALKKEVKALEAERERIRLRKEETLKAKKARELEELLSGIKGAVRKGMEMEAAARMMEG